jgi:hypothetical protein
MKLVNRETGLTTSAVKAPNFAVDDFVVVKALSFNKVQQSSTSGRKRFINNHFETTEFSRVQQGVKSGSGPGGRRFKSSRPDHFIWAQQLTTHRKGTDILHVNQELGGSNPLAPINLIPITSSN